ncbi:hypothetical protein OROGR_005766 [Orobanche gracilis]
MKLTVAEAAKKKIHEQEAIGSFVDFGFGRKGVGERPASLFEHPATLQELRIFEQELQHLCRMPINPGCAIGPTEEQNREMKARLGQELLQKEKQDS